MFIPISQMKKLRPRRWWCNNECKSTLGFPGGTSGKESACQCRRCKRRGLDPRVRRIPGSGVGNGNPLQYSCLENSMDRRAWWVTIHGIAKTGQDWAIEHTQKYPVYCNIVHKSKTVSCHTDWLAVRQYPEPKCSVFSVLCTGSQKTDA